MAGFAVLLELAVVLEPARRNRPLRFMTQAAGRMRHATQKIERDLLVHRNAKLAMKMSTVTRAAHLRNPFFDVVSESHVFSLFSH